MRYYSDLLEKVFDTKKELEEAEEKRQKEIEKEMAANKEPINDRWYVAMNYMRTATIDDIILSEPFLTEWEAAKYAKKCEGDDRDTFNIYLRYNDKGWIRKLVNAKNHKEEFNFNDVIGTKNEYIYCTDVAEYWRHM